MSRQQNGLEVVQGLGPSLRTLLCLIALIRRVYIKKPFRKIKIIRSFREAEKSFLEDEL
jgi:hypothetical protein